jgi:tetratricopeptide (TPR) repeat protein
VSNSALSAAQQALRQGDLRQADSLAAQMGSLDFEGLALRAEALFLAGYSERASMIAANLLQRLTADVPVWGRVLFTSGACDWELGNEAVGLDRLERAEGFARSRCDWSLLSRIRLQILERSAESGAAYHVSLPLSSSARQAVLRSGDRHILAEAHITFARLEARTGGADQAIRHLRHVDRLLAAEQNQWLASSALLTYANVFSQKGDIEGACELAAQAASKAERAGWMKGEAIAAGNLAFFHLSAGDLEAAQANLRRADNIRYSSPSRGPH